MKAFTLMEVLVSIMLTAIIVVAATGIWISSARGWTFAQQHQQVTGRDDLVAGRVRELFERTMLEKSSRDFFGWECQNNFGGRFPTDEIKFTTRWPMELERGRTLLVPVRGSLGSEGGKLSWSFEPFSADSRNQGEAETIVFSHELQSLNFRYWWKEAGRWIDDWRELKSWPSAIEVEMSFADNRNPPRERKFVVALPEPIEPSSLDETPEEAPTEAAPVTEEEAS